MIKQSRIPSVDTVFLMPFLNTFYIEINRLFNISFE